MESPAHTVESTADLTYAYKPSLFGAPFEFRLTPDSLQWQKGRAAGVAPYRRIRRIRLSFRPMTMQSHRFLTEIWIEGGPKLQIVSTSSKSAFEHERLDRRYRTFVTELSRRAGLAGGATAFDLGAPVLIYWLGVIVLGGAALALAALTVRALQIEAWSGAAFVGAFLAFFLWRGGNFFRRNRPGRYRPDAVPEAVLPSE